MSDTKKRPYVRTLKAWTVMDAEGNERLVRAYTAADVLRHVTPQFVIAPATHDDIISLMASGVMVETVGLPEAIPADESAGLTD
jgi:hypothetical protein